MGETQGMPKPLYDGPMIDTHHHIWDRKDVAWLADPPIPRMFGDYFGIRRDYGVEEWMADIVPEGAVKSVHVTAMWGPGKALEETQWLQAQADKHGYPHGIVCNVDLADPDVESALKAQKQFAECARCPSHALLGQRAGAARRQPAGLLHRSGVPARLRAAGKIRPAFRIAGLRRPGAIRRRPDQGVSQCAA